jgi:NAD-dependent deacetylase
VTKRNRALAELEARGRVGAVVTQNVDGLHRLAGTRELVEVHGSLASAVCLDCGTRVPTPELELPVPCCPACGSV